MAKYRIVIYVLTVVLHYYGETVAEVISIPVEKHKDQTLLCSVDRDDISQVSVDWSQQLDDGMVRHVATGILAIAPFVSVLKPEKNDWNLRIENITKERDGIYICSYKLGGKGSEIARYNISIIPERNDDSHVRPGVISVKAKHGGSIDMKCKVDDYTPDMGNVTWVKITKGANNSTEEILSENVTTVSSAVEIEYSDEKWILTLLDVDTTFNGRYVCKTNGTEFAIYDVEVEEVTLVKPLFHEETTLHCRFPAPITEFEKQKVLWKHASRHLNPNEKRTYVITTTKTYSVLRIRRPSPTDFDGSYTCGLVSKTFEKCNFEMQVQVPPKVIEDESSKSVVSASEGETVNLTCVMFGQPEPEIKWWRKQNITDAAWEGTGVKGNNLIIPNIQRYAGDQYSCVGKNMHGEKEWRIALTVQFGPEIAVLEDDVMVTAERNVQMYCLVQASPKPVMNWYRNGEQNAITSNFMYNVITPRNIEGYPAYIMSLTLLTSSAEDIEMYLGSYDCRARTGRTDVHRRIQVIEPKREPKEDLKERVTTAQPVQ